MIVTCKPHGANLIGTSKFRNEPKKALDVYQTRLPLWDGVWGRDYISIYIPAMTLSMAHSKVMLGDWSTFVPGCVQSGLIHYVGNISTCNVVYCTCVCMCVCACVCGKTFTFQNHKPYFCEILHYWNFLLYDNCGKPMMPGDKLGEKLLWKKCLALWNILTSVSRCEGSQSRWISIHRFLRQDLLPVDLKDGLSLGQGKEVDQNLPIESSQSEQRLVEDVNTIGGC